MHENRLLEASIQREVLASADAASVLASRLWSAMDALTALLAHDLVDWESDDMEDAYGLAGSINNELENQVSRAMYLKFQAERGLKS